MFIVIDKYFNWNIDGIQANTVLEGMEVTIPIDTANYPNIFVNKSIIELLNTNKNFFSVLFCVNDKPLFNSLMEEIRICYMPKDGMYYIGFNYKEMFTNILTKLGVNNSFNELPNQITNKEEFYKFIDEIKKIIAKAIEEKSNYPIEYPNDVDKEELLNVIDKNINCILKNLLSVEYQIKKYADAQIEEEKTFRENHKSLKDIKNINICWKNLMYYTSIKALLYFDKTKDIRYYRYAKNYYKNVSTNTSCEMPQALTIGNSYYDYKHEKFNRKFLAIQRLHFSELLVKLNVEDKDEITRRQTLKNGKGMKITISEEPKKSKAIDFDKVNKGLERKLKFYQGLSGKCQGIIDGLDKDTDYVGYVLNNNYVIFEKFYEISKDGTKINPAYGNRVYIATLDVLEQCDYDRSKLRKYMAKNHDYKAFKYNHTDTDSYQARINEVLDYNDISTIKFKELKLKNENKENN